MALLPLSPDELARRLGIVADVVTTPFLESALAVASQMVDPRCDSAKVTANPDAYLEGVYQLAVKVWDSGTRGLVQMDPTGTFEMSATATSGMWRSALGVLQPVLRAGGLGVG